MKSQSKLNHDIKRGPLYICSGSQCIADRTVDIGSPSKLN